MISRIVSIGLVLVSAVMAAEPQTHLLWQGFKHEWQRSIFGFTTPHRMGSIASQVQLDDKNEEARAKFTFTPGVNGDYAHPEAYYSVIKAQSSDNFDIQDYTVKLNGSDQLRTDGEYEKHNEANLTMIQQFKVAKMENKTDGAVVINGYDIGMKCIGDDCNSNGIWPFLFNIEVKKLRDEEENDFWMFETIVTLHRGWTPSKGGGKALNKQMNYDITVPVKIFRFQEGVSALSKSQLYTKHASIVDSKPFSDQLNMKLDTSTLKVEQALVGLNKIQFELLWDSSRNANRGRYIEKFETYINEFLFDLQTDTVYVDFTAGLLAPWLTTYSEDIFFQVGFTAIGLPDSVEVTASEIKSAKGSVCIDDWSSLFQCKWYGLEAKTTDYVPIDISNEIVDSSNVEGNAQKGDQTQPGEHGNTFDSDSFLQDQ